MRAIATVTLLLSAVAAGCGGASSAPVDSRAPATTGYLPTTTLAGHPSVGEGPENPMRVGEPMLVGGWNISVVQGRTVSPVDTAGAADAFYDVGVKASYGGDRTTTLASDIARSAVGRAAQMYSPRADCVDGVVINQPVQPDSVVEGFVCFDVDSSDADGLLLVVEAVDSPVPHRVFLATIPPQDLDHEAFGPVELVAALQAKGVDASVRPSPYGRTTGYMNRSSDEQILCLNQQEANLFIYATVAGAESDAETIRADGDPENVSIDLYYGRLMWWAEGRVIVNYNLADSSVSDALTETMGTSLSPSGSFFGDPPDPLPVSDVCGSEP